MLLIKITWIVPYVLCVGPTSFIRRYRKKLLMTHSLFSDLFLFHREFMSIAQPLNGASDLWGMCIACVYASCQPGLAREKLDVSSNRPYLVASHMNMWIAYLEEDSRCSAFQFIVACLLLVWNIWSRIRSLA